MEGDVSFIAPDATEEVLLSTLDAESIDEERAANNWGHAHRLGFFDYKELST